MRKHFQPTQGYISSALWPLEGLVYPSKTPGKLSFSSASTGSQVAVADCYRETVPSRNNYSCTYFFLQSMSCTHPKVERSFCFECKLKNNVHDYNIKAFSVVYTGV